MGVDFRQPKINMDDDELQSKYQRLGQEYQKVRAQVTVLKKAVLDEQASSKVIQEALKQRDQLIRKYEQDVDSLQFRNSQLSKRVEILQNELDEYERKGVKPSKQSNNSQTSISFIHQQELQMKIAENESLHKQIQEVSQQSETRTRLLETRLEMLEYEKESYEKSISDNNTKNNAIIERMKEEQLMLEAKVHKQEDDLKIGNIMIEKYSQQLKEAQKELRCKLDQTNKLIQEKMPFIDTENSELNKLNVPVCDRNHQVSRNEAPTHKAQLLIEVLTNQLIVFMAGMSDYHTYLEQRSRVYSTDIKQDVISTVNAKFCTYLLGNASYSRNVQRSLKTLQEQAQKEVFISLETLTSYADVVTAFKAYVKYLDMLMPYRIISVNEECRSSSSSKHLEKCNTKLLCEEKRLNILFKRLLSYISLLGSQDVTSSFMLKCTNVINDVFASMNSCYKALCANYVAKKEEEHSLPIYTDRLKTTDECLLSTLHSLSTSSGKLASVFQENLNFMLDLHGFVRKGLPSASSGAFPPDVRSFFNNAVEYMNLIKQDVAAPSVPYTLVVKNYRKIISSASDDETLAQQTTNTQEAIVKLETEKEHWMLEAQLLKAKYERELKKTNLLGEELKKAKTQSLLQRPTSLEDNISYEENFSPQQQHQQDRSRATQQSFSSTTSTPDSPLQQVPIGTLESINKDQNNGSPDYDHDNLVKDHMTSRIAQLTKQLQVTDSKTVHYYHEAHSLYKQIILADKTKQKLTNELLDSNKKIENLQDELETTKRSYEEQLRMLSDHLCGMNEKLTSQKDQIDELKTSGISAQPKTSKFQLPGRKR